MHFVSVSVAVSVFQTVWMVEWALEWRQTVWQDLDLMTNWFESPCVSSRLFRLVNHLMSLDHDNSLNGSLLRLLTWKKGSLGVTQVSSLDQSLPIHSDSYILTHKLRTQQHFCEPPSRYSDPRIWKLLSRKQSTGQPLFNCQTMGSFKSPSLV